MTEKETGNVQPGACVDVLPRCSNEVGYKLSRVALGTRMGHFMTNTIRSMPRRVFSGVVLMFDLRL